MLVDASGRIFAGATNKCLRRGEGSGMKIASGWQSGVLVENMSLRRGWVVRASK